MLDKWTSKDLIVFRNGLGDMLAGNIEYKFCGICGNLQEYCITCCDDAYDLVAELSAYWPDNESGSGNFPILGYYTCENHWVGEQLDKRTKLMKFMVVEINKELEARKEN